MKTTDFGRRRASRACGIDRLPHCQGTATTCSALRDHSLYRGALSGSPACRLRGMDSHAPETQESSHVGSSAPRFRSARTVRRATKAARGPEHGINPRVSACAARETGGPGAGAPATIRCPFSATRTDARDGPHQIHLVCYRPSWPSPSRSVQSAAVSGERSRREPGLAAWLSWRRAGGAIRLVAEFYSCSKAVPTILDQTALRQRNTLPECATGPPAPHATSGVRCEG